MDPANSVTQPSGSFLTPLMISLAGVVASTLAIVAYHLLLVKYCARRADEDARNPSIPTQDEGFATGVEHKMLETIPILSFSREKVKEFRTDQSECVVCLGELEEGERVRLLPNCRHFFHVPCVDNWFLAHSSCPICRTSVAVTTDSSVASPPGDDGVERVQDLPQNDDGQAHDRAASTSRVQSNTLLRHCVSLVFPRETKQKHLITGLKRSLSMDQSYILINLTVDNEKEAISSSSTSKRSLAKSNSYKARSMKQLDRMSSLLRSFSQLRIGRSSTTCGLLPY
ncbi:RING-H2 finger protein ATL52-like [Herrania umbratica]|uniref:RING-type E3 ubiquitin transferase n=1 Tax=Herrania umbratica TaxID=108875 RepID=A0A6J1ASU4_9ROSI|nr:RING-H2 finger protein ATL52-like [Herrania umbratica]